MKIESFDKEKSVVITTMGQKLVRELQSTTQEETIEKIAENESEYLADWEDKDMYKRGFVDGANWQAERMYSEEEVKRLAFDFYYDMSHKMGVNTNQISENATNVDIWFEQLKKK